MFENNFLSESWNLTGTDYAEFKKAVRALSKRTKIYRLNSPEINLLSRTGVSRDGSVQFFFNIGEKEVPIQESIILQSLLDTGVKLRKSDTAEVYLEALPSIYSRANVRLKRSAVSRKGMDYLLNELDNTKLMLSIPCGDERKFLFTSPSILVNLDRFGLKGSFLSRPSLARDVLVEQELIYRNLPVSIVTREYKTLEKSFAILSGKYCEIPQDAIFSIIKAIEKDGSLGTPVCRSWEITHYFTEINIEFPGKKMELTDHYGVTHAAVPGMTIMTSDTGDCSLKVIGTFRVGNSITRQKEVMHKHIGQYDQKSFMKSVENNIFSEYTKLADQLMKLMGEDITPPTADLTTDEGQAENLEAYSVLIDAIASEIKLSDAVGKKGKYTLVKGMKYEIDPSIPYTAYDVALHFMQLPERATGLNNKALESAVGKVPYAKAFKPITVM